MTSPWSPPLCSDAASSRPGGGEGGEGRERGEGRGGRGGGGGGEREERGGGGVYYYTKFGFKGGIYITSDTTSLKSSKMIRDPSC